MERDLNIANVGAVPHSSTLLCCVPTKELGLPLRQQKSWPHEAASVPIHIIYAFQCTVIVVDVHFEVEQIIDVHNEVLATKTGFKNRKETADSLSIVAISCACLSAHLLVALSDGRVLRYTPQREQRRFVFADELYRNSSLVAALDIVSNVYESTSIIARYDGIYVLTARNVALMSKTNPKLLSKKKADMVKLSFDGRIVACLNESGHLFMVTIVNSKYQLLGPATCRYTFFQWSLGGAVHSFTNELYSARCNTLLGVGDDGVVRIFRECNAVGFVIAVQLGPDLACASFIECTASSRMHTSRNTHTDTHDIDQELADKYGEIVLSANDRHVDEQEKLRHHEASSGVTSHHERRLVWVLVYEIVSGDWVLYCIAGLYARPRPRAQSSEFVRVASHNARIASCIICCPTTFVRRFAWEKAPGFDLALDSWDRPPTPHTLQPIVHDNNTLVASLLRLEEKHSLGVATLGGHAARIKQFACTTSDELLASLDIDGNVWVWLLPSANLFTAVDTRARLRHHGCIVGEDFVCIAWRSNHELVCVQRSHCIHVYKHDTINTWTIHQRINIQNDVGDVVNVRVDINDRMIIACVNGLIVSSVHTMKLRASSSTTTITSFDVLHDNSVVAGTRAGELVHWAANGVTLDTYTTFDDVVVSVRALTSDVMVCVSHTAFGVFHVRDEIVCEMMLQRFTVPSNVASFTLGDSSVRIAVTPARSDSNTLPLTLYLPCGVARWRNVTLELRAEQTMHALYISNTGVLVTQLDTTLAVIPAHRLYLSHASTLVRPLPLFCPSILVELVRHSRIHFVHHILKRLRRELDNMHSSIIHYPLAFVLECITHTSSFTTDISADIRLSDDDAVVLRQRLAARTLPLLDAKQTMHVVDVIDALLYVQALTSTIDEAGARFVFNVLIQKASLQDIDAHTFAWSNAAWAMVSHTQSTLLNVVAPTTLSASSTDLSWECLRQHGVGFWPSNLTDLQSLIGRVARQSFLHARKPLHALLWYIALGKRSAFAALLKSQKNIRNHRLQQLLTKPIIDTTTAIKTAFAMVSARKYQAAVAFFLLANAHNDAYSVCISSLRDPALAVLLCRLAGGDLKELLHTMIVPFAIKNNNYWLLFVAKRSLATNNEHHSIDELQRIQVNCRGALTLLDVLNESTPLSSQLHMSSAYECHQLQWPLLALLHFHAANQHSHSSLTHVDDAIHSFLALRISMKACSRRATFTRSAQHIEHQSNEINLDDISPSNQSTEKSVSISEDIQYGVRNSQDSTHDESLLQEVSRLRQLWTFDHTQAISCMLRFTSAHQFFTIHLAILNEQQQYERVDAVLRDSVESLATLIRTRDISILSPHDCRRLSYGARELRNFQLAHWQCSNSVRVEHTQQSATQSVHNANDNHNHNVVLSALVWTSAFISAFGQRTLCCKALLELLRSHLFDDLLDEVVEIVCIATNVCAEASTHADTLNDTAVNRCDDDGDIKYGVSHADTHKCRDDDKDAFIDVEIEHLADELFLFTSTLRFVELLRERFVNELDTSSCIFVTIKILVDALQSWLDEHSHLLAYRVSEASQHCLLVARTGVVDLESLLLPLRNGPWKKTAHTKRHLYGFIGAQRIANSIADDIYKSCMFSCSTHGSSFAGAVDVFTGTDLVLGVAFNRVAPAMVVVGTDNGLREFNLESSLRFRSRSQSTGVLVEPELLSWEGCYHRFAHQESLPPNCSDSYMYPVPLLRVDLLAHDIGTLDKSLPHPSEVMYKESDVYGDFNNCNTDLALHDAPVTCVASHPTLPLYISSSRSEVIDVFHFGWPRAVAEFRYSSLDHITRIRFNKHGDRFGVAMTSGRVGAYRFGHGSKAYSTQPLETIAAHKVAWDLCFMHSGGLLATAGVSSRANNVRVWDTLLPPDRSCVTSYQSHTSASDGATSLCFIADRHMLVVGGGKGHIEVFDTRATDEIPLFTNRCAHSGRIHCLTYDVTSDCVISGGVDGHVKVWNAMNLELQKDCGEVFESKRVFNHRAAGGLVQRFGTTALACTEAGILAAGAQGNVKYIKRL